MNSLQNMLHFKMLNSKSFRNQVQKYVIKIRD